MPDKRPPKDSNQLAKYLVDVTSGEAEKMESQKKPYKQINKQPLKVKPQQPKVY